MPAPARFAAAIVAVLLTTASTGVAQELPELPLNSTVGATLRAAARVHIYTRDGKRAVGSRANVGNETLDLWVDGAWRSFGLVDLARIDVAERDSLKNGAVVGAILGLLCAYLCGQELNGKGQLKESIVVNTTAGALIGVGIDAAIRKRRTVYVRSAVSPTVGSRGMLSYQRRF